MQSGKLRHKIGIFEKRHVKDDYGQAVDMWQKICDRYADIKPASSKNFVIADQLHTGRQLVIKIRMADNLTEDMRIMVAGVMYNIFSIQPDPTLRRDQIVQIYEAFDGE